ncbi:hypothetical protein Btru_075441 [Bulinus truncatus]|nr:hypothetical protein Btru_075441 [Bulinus truncatus]
MALWTTIGENTMVDVLHYLELRAQGLTNGHRYRQCQTVVKNLLEDVSAKPVHNVPCEFSGEPRATFLMDFSPNMLRVASTHGDHTVRVTDIRTGKCTHILTGHPRTPWCLAFNPTSNDILASGCLGGEIRIWDLLGGGSEVLRNPCAGQVITSLAFHPTGQVLVFAAMNNIYFWDWSKSAPFSYTQTAHDYERIRWLRFDPFGQYLYTGIANNTTVHRDRDINAPIITISDDSLDLPSETSRLSTEERSAHQEIHRMRYQSLLHRFMAYQQDRNNRVNRYRSSPSPRSPVHEEGLESARQYARHMTTLERSFQSRSQDSQEQPRTSEAPPSLVTSVPSRPSTPTTSDRDFSLNEQPRNFSINRSFPTRPRPEESMCLRRWGRYEPLFFSRRPGVNSNSGNESNIVDHSNNVVDHGSSSYDSFRSEVPVRSTTTTERPFTVRWPLRDDPGARHWTRGRFSSSETAGSSAASSSSHVRNENAASESLDANEFEILPVDQERESHRGGSNNGSSSSGSLTNTDVVASWDDLRALLNRIGHRTSDASSASSGAAAVTGVTPPCLVSSSAASTAEGTESHPRSALLRLLPEPTASPRHTLSRPDVDRGSGSVVSSVPGHSSNIFSSNIFSSSRHQEVSESPPSLGLTSLSSVASGLQAHSSRFDCPIQQDPVVRNSEGPSLVSESPSVHFRFNSNEGHSWRRQMINRHRSFELAEGADFYRHSSSLLDRSLPRHVSDQTSQTLGAMNLPASSDQCTDVADLGEHSLTVNALESRGRSISGRHLLEDDDDEDVTSSSEDTSLEVITGTSGSEPPRQGVNGEARYVPRRGRIVESIALRNEDDDSYGIPDVKFYAGCGASARDETVNGDGQRINPSGQADETNSSDSSVARPDARNHCAGDGGDFRPSMDDVVDGQETSKDLNQGHGDSGKLCGDTPGTGDGGSLQADVEDVRSSSKLSLASSRACYSGTATRGGVGGSSHDSPQIHADSIGCVELSPLAEASTGSTDRTSVYESTLQIDPDLFEVSHTIFVAGQHVHPGAQCSGALLSSRCRPYRHLPLSATDSPFTHGGSDTTSPLRSRYTRSITDSPFTHGGNDTVSPLRSRYTRRLEPFQHSSARFENETLLSRLCRRRSLLRPSVPCRRAQARSSILRAALNGSQATETTSASPAVSTSSSNSYLYRTSGLPSELNLGLRPNSEQRSAFSVFSTANRDAPRASSSFLNPASANPTASSSSSSGANTSLNATGQEPQGSSTETSSSSHLEAVRDVQERLQQAVQQLREVQTSVRELTMTAPHQLSLMRSDSVTEYLERRVSELDRRISDLENNYNTRIRELGHDFLIRRIQSNRERRRGSRESPYLRSRYSSLLRPSRRSQETDSSLLDSLPSRVRSPSRPPNESGDAPPTRPQQLLSCLARPMPPLPESLRARNLTTADTTMPTSVTIHRPPRNEDSSEENSTGSGNNTTTTTSSQRYWLNLQQLHLHPDYSTSILDDTINRPNDAMQRLMNRTIAGAFLQRDEHAVANNIVPQTHRIQRWDISKSVVPDISNASANIIVKHCKLHNDASCDISKDGSLLVTFVSSYRGFPDNNILGVFSLRNETLAQCLYTKSFGPNAISVSISPVNRYVLVGLAAKRFFFSQASQMVAQVYKLERQKAGENSMKHITDLFHPANQETRNHMSVNSARWLPGVGEGMVYGTNRGDLHFCRPGSRKVYERDSPKPRGLLVFDSWASRFHRSHSAHSSIATQTNTTIPVEFKALILVKLVMLIY